EEGRVVARPVREVLCRGSAGEVCHGGTLGPPHSGAPGGPARPVGPGRHDGGVPQVEVRAVSAVDDVLRDELLTCWTDVSNAGGAVGFVPPVTREDVAPVLDHLLEGVHSGRDVLAVLTVDGATAGWAALVGSHSPLRSHWATVLRVQVHPA